jgi:invasion protein IalB
LLVRLHSEVRRYASILFPMTSYPCLRLGRSFQFTSVTLIGSDLRQIPIQLRGLKASIQHPRSMRLSGLTLQHYVTNVASTPLSASWATSQPPPQCLGILCGTYLPRLRAPSLPRFSNVRSSDLDWLISCALSLSSWRIHGLED